MKPELWGKHFWFVMHTVAYTYPEQPTYTDKKNANDFFTSLGGLLPCETCRDHYYEHLRVKPITTSLDSRADLMNWVYEIHNSVNRSIGKPVISKEEAHRRYTQFIIESRQQGKPNYKMHLFYGSIITALVLLLFFSNKK